MDALFHPVTIAAEVHAVVIAAVGVRVVMAKPVPGVALAWLLLVVLLPLFGLLFYLAIGERRVGGRRARRLRELRRPYEEGLLRMQRRHEAAIDWAGLPEAASQLHRLGLATTGHTTSTGNDLELVAGADEVLERLLADVVAARSTVHLQFYIWHPGGRADDLAEAVRAAAARGVRCRVLVDAIGSAAWLRGEQPRRLRAAGAEVMAALPSKPWRALFRRHDLRNHRKIAVIDGEVGWTGSMNAVDPRCFKQGKGLGQWIDAMVRVRGPAVTGLNAVMLADWFMETGQPAEELIRDGDLKVLPAVGSVHLQQVPSGPAVHGDALLQMLVTMLYAARHEIVVTTPYFVPEDAMARALRAAASRGVAVTLIVPHQVDSRLVHHASQSYYRELMADGVQICRFRSGLLHTKSIVVDGCIAMFGTANLDMRSIWLNYEISLFVYDREFGSRLRGLQQQYLQQCTALDLAAWRRRSFAMRLLDNSARLLSPLL